MQKHAVVDRMFGYATVGAISYGAGFAPTPAFCENAKALHLNYQADGRIDVTMAVTLPYHNGYIVGLVEQFWQVVRYECGGDGLDNSS
ncbi:MAG: hypothetical protein AVDCRST_MAG93-8687 [uncultured Chloroflexia bacterium]|uniref:Uncharacterized protein n=1 Tax=uncultured Chloroflexia bacterium TaxID=1672391 RepID=A0A6J4N246_9CHLR|nr:MAG: hypothetical protein AVDCRST_MAG93-8687 [uncultured Chloroflexia bacterium]